MMNLAFVYLQAQGGFDGSFMIMMIAIFAIMYFFMIRPQNKKQKEIQNFRNNLQMGQDVITAGGIYGKVKSIEGNVVTLEIASGVKIRIDKNSIYADAAATQQQAKYSRIRNYVRKEEHTYTISEDFGKNQKFPAQ